MSLDFKDLVVLITGAGGGIGKAYAKFYGSRGAKVVVNDVSPKAAQAVFDEIVKEGGQAAIAPGSVTEGQAIVDQAVKAFGTVHVLINNAGILRDRSFKKMSDKEWDDIIAVHLKGAYAMTKAVWPIFRQQKWGRVINTASPAGVYGNMGQVNYSTAKAALTTFSKALTQEGKKYNIKANTIVPLAASAMTETIMPPEFLKGLRPEHLAPLVGVLTAKNGPDVGGRFFELGGGFYSELRWERSNGQAFKVDESFTPSAVAGKWNEVKDFSTWYPYDKAPNDMKAFVEGQKSMPSNAQGPAVDFKGQTVVITGAGNGLGRAYAHDFAKLGANVVINDVVAENANKVVEEVNALGGKGAAAVCSAEEGEKIIKTAIDNFGGIQVLICNAGILRDKAFVNMTDKMWDDVMAVHLKATYRCCKAAWPYMQDQKYGRIVVTSSPNGLIGAHGQCNYATAKAGIIGFARSLAIEGKKNNIFVNAIAPRAGTQMTATVWTKDMLETFKPEFVSPFVVYMASKNNKETGKIFEGFGGFAAEVRWGRSGGKAFPNNRIATPEQIAESWDEITRFDDRETWPTSAAESGQQIFGNFENVAEDDASGEDYSDPEDTEEIRKAKKTVGEPSEYTYTARDVILYNIGIGAGAKDLDHTYEHADNFGAFPSFGVIPQFFATPGFNMDDVVPNFNPAKLLHGEQYLQIKAPIPTEGTLVSTVRLREVLDKGKAAAVTTAIETKDKATGKVIFENQSTVFIRGSGGFGGKKNGVDRGNATAVNTPPSRKPDAVVEEKTSEDQAAIYRLSGDYNPLHIDPAFSSMGGFPKPILHGLCSLGFAGRHVLNTYGPYEDLKVRFAGTVIPGETLVTEMWKEGNKVIFRTSVKDRNAPAISNAAATLVSASAPKSKL